MTTDDGAQQGSESGAAASAALDGTIWPEVDRALAGVTATAEPSVLDVIVWIPRDEIVRGLRALKHDANLKFDYLRSLTCVDNEEEGMDVVYHLYSIEHGYNLTVKAHLPVDDLNLDSATPVWRAANWYEREAAEMFGVRFRGHPDPRTLLMPEDMTDTFPLRKDHPLAEIEVLQGEALAFPSGAGGGGEEE
ncbi:MAG: NADH-quinone oxidoreductase subunit C [Dehalococcoidia bacterium]|nr:NADH-quinone oxidoreductase subunit C [Dehalococcoidia bacterium]HRC62290.1 NADH-quinone oxidoreductase subunit C [Dehalococcoidia bacterium]